MCIRDRLVGDLASLAVEARQARGQRGDGLAGFGHALQQDRHTRVAVAAEMHGGENDAAIGPLAADHGLDGLLAAIDGQVPGNACRAYRKMIRSLDRYFVTR